MTQLGCVLANPSCISLGISALLLWLDLCTVTLAILRVLATLLWSGGFHCEKCEHLRALTLPA